MRGFRRRKRLSTPFTLMEVLVASCVIGICLSILLSGFSITMKNAELARNYATAIRLGNLKFDSLVTAPSLKQKDERGKFGNDFPGFDWHTSVKRNKETKEWFIKVEVLWGRGNGKRNFTLETMRIIPDTKKHPGKADGPKQKENKSRGLNTG